MQFQAIVSEQSHQINCITKSRALTLLFELRIERICSALQLLRIIKSENLTEHLLEFYHAIKPDNGQLETISDALNIKICRLQTLELAQRYYCDRERVVAF
jgi:hypothetical protein